MVLSYTLNIIKNINQKPGVHSGKFSKKKNIFGVHIGLFFQNKFKVTLGRHLLNVLGPKANFCRFHFFSYIAVQYSILQ